MKIINLILQKIGPHLLPFIPIVLGIVMIVAAFYQDADHSEPTIPIQDTIFVDADNDLINSESEDLFSRPDEMICYPENDAGTD